MGFSTVGIAFLPCYEVCGFSSSLLLVLFRFLQGIATGGEINGASVYAIEESNQERCGFISSLIKSSSGFGAILATIMGLIFTNEYIPDWTWRVPFFFGGVITIIGLYFRRVLGESETPIAITAPILNVVKKHTLSFFRIIGISSFLHVPYYVIVGYMNPNLYSKGLMSIFTLMLMNSAITIIGTIALPIWGYFSDKVGHGRFMVWAALAQMFFIFPIFFIYTQEKILCIFISQIVLLLLAEAFIAPASAFMNTLFPNECRYSGVAFGDCLGIAIFGGTTPLICHQLAKLIDPLWGPCIYVFSTALLGIISIGCKIEKSLFQKIT